MRRLLVAILGASTLSACQTSSEDTTPRHVDVSDQVSFVVPPGFHLTRDRETWVLVGDTQLARSTIAVRSVPRDGWSEDRSLDMLVPVTAEALQALPKARVVGPSDPRHPILDGAAFDVIFEPVTRPGERYRRRHVVLVGETRVIHVLMTGPEKLADQATASFNRLLDSIREEA